MSIGAQPLAARDVAAICDRKMADFQHKAAAVELRHLDPDSFCEAAAGDPDVQLALQTGFMADLGADLRDPILARVAAGEVFTCPHLACRVLADEPPELHRAFVEGAFLRKLLRFFVPATVDGGEGWEATEQVRQIMAKHFAFQLVAVETVLASAS